MKIKTINKIMLIIIIVPILLVYVLYKIKGKELFLNYSTTIEYFCPTPSPDGKYVYYLADVKHNRTIKGMNAMNLYGPQLHESLLMRINVDGSDKKIILKMPDTNWPYLLFSVLNVTLDGTKIAYTPAPGRGIWVVNTDGTKNQQVVDSGTNPSWSPDGTKIVYENEKVLRTNDGGERGIFYETQKGGINIIDLDNNKTTRIGEDNYSHSPKWSPDGKLIAYQYRINDNPNNHVPSYDTNIYLYDLINHYTSKILDKGEILFWSIKADKIYYQDSHGNFDEIYLTMESAENETEDNFMRYSIGEYYDNTYSSNPNYLVEYDIRTNKANKKTVLEKNVKKLIY